MLCSSVEYAVGEIYEYSPPSMPNCMLLIAQCIMLRVLNEAKHDTNLCSVAFLLAPFTFLFFTFFSSLIYAPSPSLFYTPSPSPSFILPLLLSHLYSLFFPFSILPLLSLFYTPSPSLSSILPLLYSLSSPSSPLSSPPPSYSRTPQSPRVGTTITKKARNSPATTEPTSIPVPVTRTTLSGTKRLRSVSLEKLPASLTAKRPSRTPTQDSTPVEHPPTFRTGGIEGTFIAEL